MGGRIEVVADGTNALTVSVAVLGSAATSVNGGNGIIQY